MPIVSCAQLLPHNRRDARALRTRQRWARAGLQWPHHRDLRRRALTTIVELRPAQRNRGGASDKLSDHQDRAAVHPAACLDRVAYALTVDPCPRFCDWRHIVRGPGPINYTVPRRSFGYGSLLISARPETRLCVYQSLRRSNTAHGRAAALHRTARAARTQTTGRELSEEH